MTQIALIPEAGKITPWAIFKLLANIGLARQDCAFALTHGEDKKIFFFKQGEPIGCLTNILDEMLVSYLQKKGQLTPAQVKVCLAQSGSQQDLPFAEALVGKGVMNAISLNEVLKSLLEDRLLRSLDWQAGEYRLGPAQKMAYAPANLDRPLLQLLVSRLLESPFLTEALDAIATDEVPLLVSVGGFNADAFALRAKDTAILRQVNGVSSVEQIAGRSKNEVEQVRRLLAALKLMGLVRMDPAPVKKPAPPPPAPAPAQPAEVEESAAAIPSPAGKPVIPAPPTPDAQPSAAPKPVIPAPPTPVAKPATSPKPGAKDKPSDEQILQQALDKVAQAEERLKGKNYFEILGVTEESYAEEVKKAYFDQVKTLHPDRMPKAISAEVRRRGEDLFGKISEAYNTLIDDEKREEYVAGLRLKEDGVTDESAMKALQSEVEFQKAEVLIRKGDFEEAEKTLRQAIEFYDQEPEYYVHLGWAIYRAGKKRGQNTTSEARSTIEKGLVINQKLVQGHYYLGQIAKIEKDPERAMHYFNKVVELDPKHHEASRELRLMERSKSKASSGLKGLFKKKG